MNMLFEGDKPIGDPFAMEMKCGRLPRSRGY
ncbi:MAG: hypothetical protein JWP25_5130 [Bradyrhizobium sp.]|nr:hypothetical protein [Bradyrhizobium sp.]